MSKRVCTVIVTYHSGERIAGVLRALMEQVQCAYIIDNGSDEHTRQQLQECYARYPDRVKLVLNDSNLGLAAAQNQGIRLALAEQFEWVLLIDDDSLAEAGMVDYMLAAWQKRDDEHIGILAPRIIERKTSTPYRYLVPWCGVGFSRKTVKTGSSLSDVAMVIASGSMIKSEVFSAVGLMNEGFFIDSVDHEFCLRARAHGYMILVVGKSMLNHQQGNKQRYALLDAIPIVTSGYQANRRYTIFRNRIFVLRRYGRKFPFLLLHTVTVCAWDVTRILLCEPKKIEKLINAWRGLVQGVLYDIPKGTRI